MNIFFTSDTHFFHTKMALKRGFSGDEEMNEMIISNWNSVVGRKDTVYHLGDFGFKHPLLRKTRFRLNGKIHLIIGNHDMKNKPIMHDGMFSSIIPLTTISIEKKPIVLCHFQMRVWDRSHYNSWHLFGHTHTGMNSPKMSTGEGKCFDVGVDNWDFSPISYEQVCEIMVNRPDNFNLARERF